MLLKKGVEMMYSALEIAKWFLAENRIRMVSDESDYITHLKLHPVSAASGARSLQYACR